MRADWKYFSAVPPKYRRITASDDSRPTQRPERTGRPILLHLCSPLITRCRNATLAVSGQTVNPHLGATQLARRIARVLTSGTSLTR